ncbi:hypothetical protein K1W69_15680 [Hoeflea sp. WL0058]|uniref:Uncharacterized protein n=1 Tax=Flavimaribacter sediminis TaxID=2865987 RepID=A0AAE2ZLW2_9HYPH|nr:hypothetical protein [Flavimaribacter sediminis]MBW8638636.1 hypothetical protein [Flavimaribacter sediminis]
MPDLEHVLVEQLADYRSGWSMGSFGAIAEFHQDDGEPCSATSLERVTARGDIRILPQPEMTPVAYETLSLRPHRWSQSVALCLPLTAASRANRSALTELGPDAGALREQDRGAILFDMGLSQIQVDFCIRTSDQGLIDALRAHAGRSLFEPGNPVMGRILSAHPHRVALTGLGRVEVYQKIGGPETGGRSPEGPHTHVLPKLLKAGRTHSANVPIPDGLVPCAGLYPGNPVIGPLGEDRDVDPDLFDAFQTLLRAWGNRDYIAARDGSWRALEAGLAPHQFDADTSRQGRAGLRNGLRQWRRRHGDSALLEEWSRAFDKGASDIDETGHET